MEHLIECFTLLLQALQELATTPLMLSVLTLAYVGKPVEAVRTSSSPELRRQHVFATYVERMLQHRGRQAHSTQEQTKHWLAWLARQLMRQNQTEFYLERMQPEWLPKSRQWWEYRIVSSLLGGLLFGLGVVLSGGLSLVGLSVGLGSVLGGLFGGLSPELLDKQNIVSPNQGIWSSMRNGLVVGLVGGLVGGLLFGVFIGVVGGLLFGGSAFIQHFVLRWFLRDAGAMPWNYVRFLDYAADHLLLRKVGGGYIFIHRLLLEYFASLPLPQSLVNNEQTQQAALAQEEPASPTENAES